MKYLHLILFLVFFNCGKTKTYTSLKEALKTPEKVYKLQLNKKQITAITEEQIKKFTNLTDLYLSNNQLSTLPQSIGSFSNLEVLNLSNNQLTTLPESIAKLTHLTSLNLGYNKLTALHNISALTNLKRLDLGGNQLTELPENIGKLTNLTHLHLNNNQLKTLPETIKELTNLTLLNLRNNLLKTPLPEGMYNPYQGPQIIPLPYEMRYLTNLTTLYLGHNELTKIPEHVIDLNKLTLLDLQDNMLKTLPESINYLTELKTLDLSTNLLQSIPENIGHLKHLNTLRLNKNQLTAIPKSISKLQNLNELNLCGNLLSSLPEFIQNLRKTKIVKTCNPGNKAIAESNFYYFDSDTILHYKTKLDREGEYEFNRKKNKTKSEKALHNIMNQNAIKTLKDTAVIASLKNIGFTEQILNKNQKLVVNNLFSSGTKNKQEKSGYTNYTPCGAIFRDVLIFKKHSKITGIVKVCFGCKAILLANLENKNYQKPIETNKDYSDLYTILNPEN